MGGEDEKSGIGPRNVEVPSVSLGSHEMFRDLRPSRSSTRSHVSSARGQSDWTSLTEHVYAQWLLRHYGKVARSCWPETSRVTDEPSRTPDLR